MEELPFGITPDNFDQTGEIMEGLQNEIANTESIKVKCRQCETEHTMQVPYWLVDEHECGHYYPLKRYMREKGWFVEGGDVYCPLCSSMWDEDDESHQ